MIEVVHEKSHLVFVCLRREEKCPRDIERTVGYIEIKYGILFDGDALVAGGTDRVRGDLHGPQ